MNFCCEKEEREKVRKKNSCSSSGDVIADLKEGDTSCERVRNKLFNSSTFKLFNQTTNQEYPEALSSRGLSDPRPLWYMRRTDW